SLPPSDPAAQGVVPAAAEEPNGDADVSLAREGVVPGSAKHIDPGNLIGVKRRALTRDDIVDRDAAGLLVDDEGGGVVVAPNGEDRAHRLGARECRNLAAFELCDGWAKGINCPSSHVAILALPGLCVDASSDVTFLIVTPPTQHKFRSIPKAGGLHSDVLNVTAPPQ